MSDIESRDQLADLIERSGLTLDRGPYVELWTEDEQEVHHRPNWPDFAQRAEAVQKHRRERLADSAIDSGWRPPPRVIETAEELAGMVSDGSIVRSATGLIALRVDYSAGVTFGDQSEFAWGSLVLPVTVLWTPERD